MAAQNVPRVALSQRLAASGPKRVLSLDGGGVRGLLSAGILAEIEKRLARRSGRSDFRLCDYFDLIGGTSTGSIIAAGLAMGRSAEDITKIYQELIPNVFEGDGSQGLRRPRFNAQKLDEALLRELGDHELGSAALRTGFAVFAKRIDTGSLWTLTNNPRSQHWDGPHGGYPNKRFKIRQLVAASAAAPTFFEERCIQLIPEGEPVPPGADTQAEFVDGGVAALNDPSLQLLEVATLKPYGFGWQSGDHNLLMVSVGTGYWRPALNYDAEARDLLSTIAPEAARAVFALTSMIHDASLNTLVTMQAMSEPAKPWRINSEIGEMRGARITPAPALHFQRFDARLDDPEELKRLALTYELGDIELMKNMASNDPATLARLHEIGLRAGEDYFRRRQGEPDWESLIFPSRFDPAWFSGSASGPPKSRLEAMGRLMGGKPRK